MYNERSDEEDNTRHKRYDKGSSVNGNECKIVVVLQTFAKLELIILMHGEATVHSGRA